LIDQLVSDALDTNIHMVIVLDEGVGSRGKKGATGTKLVVRDSVLCELSLTFSLYAALLFVHGAQCLRIGHQYHWALRDLWRTSFGAHPRGPSEPQGIAGS
jgi:hypothetical protein